MMTKMLIELKSQEELEKLISKCIHKSTKKIMESLAEDDKILFTSKQICAYLQISRVKLWQLQKLGIIPFIRVGNSLRFNKKEVLKALNINI